jgi:hypothetical protein
VERWRRNAHTVTLLNALIIVAGSGGLSTR